MSPPCQRCTDDCNQVEEDTCQKTLLAGNEVPVHRHHKELI